MFLALAHVARRFTLSLSRYFSLSPFDSLCIVRRFPFRSLPLARASRSRTRRRENEVGERSRADAREKVERRAREGRRDGERTEPARSRERTRVARGRKSERAGAFAWGAIAARHSKPANGRASSHGTGPRLREPTRFPRQQRGRQRKKRGIEESNTRRARSGQQVRAEGGARKKDRFARLLRERDSTGVADPLARSLAEARTERSGLIFARDRSGPRRCPPVGSNARFRQ